MKNADPHGSSQEKSIAAELTDILYNNALRTNMVVIAATVIVLAIFWGKISPAFSVTWAVCIVLSAIYRLRLLHSYRNCSDLDDKSEEYYRKYLLGTLSVSLCWMAIVIVGLLMEDFEHRIFFTLLLVSLLGASVPSLASSLGAIYIYILTPSVAAIPLLFYQGGADSGIAIALIIYIFMMIKSGQHVYETLVTTIKLRHNVESLNQSLEKMVAERTKELENALDEAERANNAKTIFLANISHEIRTPLNVIINASQLALSEKLSRKAETFIYNVKRSGQTLLGIINDILDLTKIESGGFTITREPFNLRELIENIRQDYELFIQEQQCDFHIDYTDTGTSHYWGDPLRVSQVLSNIIGNAIKFTENGEVSVIVREKNQNELSQLEIVVNDTGIGIASHQQDKLFQPFQQADDSMTRKYGGSGLGLVISKQLVELMGGTIGVQSTLGKGSRFTVLLPAEPVSEQEERELRNKTETGSLEENADMLNGKRALVVDDIEANQMIMKNILMNFGMSSFVAANGKDAVKLLSEEAVDIVFMDIQMPVMDGYKATARIRKMPDFSSIPIIAMTANAMSEDVEKCYANGMNHCLVKPLKIDEVYGVLQKHLS